MKQPWPSLPCLRWNLTVASVSLTEDASLILDFHGGHTLRVSGTAQAWTTHDVWWLSDPHAS